MAAKPANVAFIQKMSRLTVEMYAKQKEIFIALDTFSKKKDVVVTDEDCQQLGVDFTAAEFYESLAALQAVLAGVDDATSAKLYRLVPLA